MLGWYACSWSLKPATRQNLQRQAGLPSKVSLPLIICIYLVTVKDPSLERSGTQQDSSEDPVTNIKDPGAHLTSGGSLSVLPQRATFMPKHCHTSVKQT
jgi:hypothetical protein